MQSFAEFLKKYLTEQNISYNNAAKMCGVDRTILGRYVNGSRKPKDKEMVLKLATGLQMSPENSELLCEAYRRTKISEEYHTSYETIAAIVGKKHIIKKIETVYEYKVFPEQSSYNLYIREEILGALRYIKTDATFMKIKFNPSYFEEDDEFKNIFIDIGKDCQVEHMITLEHSQWQYGEGKMKSLENLLPFLFGRESGKVYYHYQRESREEDSVKLNYMMTDKGIVFFNQDMSKGFFSNQMVPCSYYGRLFEGMKSKCRIFAEGGEEVYLSFQGQMMDTFFSDDKSGISFCDQPDQNCLWLVNEERKTAVCIREIEIVQLLRTFIWGSDDSMNGAV